MKQLSKKTQSILYVALCILLWSLLPLTAKLGQVGLDHHQYLFYSSVISFLSLFTVALFTKRTHELFKYSGKMYAFLIVLGFLDFFYYLLLYFGYQKANGLEVLVMQSTWPIFIVLLSLVILKEKLTMAKTVSLVLGFLGVVMVITKGNVSSIDFSNITVIGIVLLGALSFALFSVLSKKISINPTNMVTINFLSAIVYSLISMLTFSSFVFPNAQEWIFIMINGVLVNGISYLFWIKALQYGDASFIAPFIFMTPILSATLLILVLDEPMLPIYFVGLVLIVLSGLANSFKKKSLN